MKRLKSAFFAGILGLLFVVSCRRDDPSWDLDLTAPIAYGSMSINDVLDDSITCIGADGSLRICYRASIPGINSDSLFSIPDTTLYNPYAWPFGPSDLFPNQLLVGNQATQTTYQLGSAQLLYGILERGKAKVHFKNDMMCPMLVTYVLQSATFNSVAATISYVVPAAPSTTQASVMDVELDLTGYEIDFTGLNGDRINTLVTIFSISVDGTAPVGGTPVTNSDSVSVDITFEDIKPSYVRGYFGSDDIQIGPEESYVDFFSKVQSGSLGLDSITMTFSLENYTGLDARFTVNNLWSRRSLTSQTVNLNHSLIGQSININRAAYSFSDPPSIPSLYSWTFNNANSNIVDMFEIMPDYLGYDFTLLTNPLGNVSGNNDFIYTRFGINAFIDVDMPVNFYADQIVLVDTVATDFGITNPEDIREANLRLFVGNSFPFGANIELYMLDENNNLVDQIVTTPGLVASAPLSFLNGYYFSNGATQSMLTIPLDEMHTQLLLASTRIVMKATFDTGTNPNYVKIFTTNRLDFNLTADFEYRVN
jgi:hypothetical protein